MRLRSELRVNPGATFTRRTNLRKSHLPANLADTYTECNQGVGVDLFFVLPDSENKCFEFLNIADLATRTQHLLSSIIQKAR